MTPVRDPQVANSTGDDATTPQEAAAKVQMLMERLKAGASFRDLAMGYSEDPESAPRGGDLGFVPVSRLKQAPPPLRDAVLNKAPGAVNVASAGGAHTLVLVVGARAGRTTRSVDAGRARAHHRNAAGAQRATAARRLPHRRAQRREVVNYLARRLVESKGNMPSLHSPRRVRARGIVLYLALDVGKVCVKSSSPTLMGGARDAIELCLRTDEMERAVNVRVLLCGSKAERR